ncbi:MAG: enoyl-CoA hydratase [Thermodesulfobacteriota bacterium]|nr:enoyl-CoA hydratase [Thermodesulfobacteriota bacterium]
MDFETIILHKEDGIATLTLNRPDSMNSMNTKMAEDLQLCLDDMETDDSIKVIVITGAGRGFCSGADLSTITTPNVFESILHKKEWIQGSGESFVKRLMNLDKLVITSVNGPAIGAGFGFALAGDIIIASENARFQMVFVNIGLVPDAGSLLILPRLIGIAKAKELGFNGEMLDAKEAERIGLVNRVVPAGELESETQKLALRYAKGPSKAFGFMKKIMNIGLDTNNIDTVMAHEAQAQVLLFETEDFKEGVKAFSEKRPPQFKGK